VPLVKKPGRVIGSIGDVNAFVHGGGVIYAGDYGPQLWYTHGLEVDSPEADEELGSVWVYRVDLGKDAADFASDYDWVDWHQVLDYAGIDHEELAGIMQSPLGRADLIATAMSYHGSGEFDSQPIQLRLGELGRRHW
jgi:hypothetical protein